jgi:hypothetical protein
LPAVAPQVAPVLLNYHRRLKKQGQRNLHTEKDILSAYKESFNFMSG